MARKGKPSSDGVRVRGRKGQAMRARRLDLHPTCAECAKRGIVRATTVIDHVLPLAFGGLDVDDNTQGLCDFCNAVKTALESSSSEAAATHPDWLRPSAVPLTIVCGPPAGGKSTFVGKHAEPGDVVIDMDGIAAEISAGFAGQSHEVRRFRWNKGLLDAAMRKRNAMLGALASASGCRAWFIVSAPSANERHWWAVKLGGEVVLLDPGMGEAIRRACDRGDARTDHVLRWYSEGRKPWSLERRRLPRQGVDEAGYPLAAEGPDA